MASYLVGIDGGGTKTKLIVSNLSRQVLGSANGAQANLTAGGLGLAAFNLREGIRQLLEPLPAAPIEVMVLSLAGLDNNHERENAEQILLPTFNLWQIKKLVLLNDTISALKGNSNSETAMVLISGTGSQCFAINGKYHYSVGGLDYLLSDEGSGYDIGRLTLRASVASMDGRTIQSSLPQAVLTHFKVNSIRELKQAVYHPPLSKSEIAALAKITVKKMREGDNLAKTIIDNALAHLLGYVQTVHRALSLPSKFDLVLSGTLIINLADLFTPLVQKHFPHVKIIIADKDPALGSLKIAQLIYQGVKPNTFWYY